MYKVETTDSNGTVLEGKTRTARDAAHADRLRARIRETFPHGSSRQVLVTKI